MVILMIKEIWWFSKKVIENKRTILILKKVEKTVLKKVKKENLSAETILFLFKKIGFTSSFVTNGEFYVLTLDWLNAYPLFNLIMTT